MGWELRHGNKRYLYRNRRVDGKRRKEYLASEAPLFGFIGFGEVMADELHKLERRQRKLRKLTRKARSEFRKRITDLLDSIQNANTELRTVCDGLLASLGYHKHHRGEWRMKRDLSLVKEAISKLEQRFANNKPLVNYTAPTDDAEAVEVFAKARAGDADAQARLRQLIRERDWLSWIGDLGQQATQQLIHKAAAGDAVWKAGIAQKANTLREELLGEKPSVLETLLVRRVVNGWIAVHALELELTIRPPADARDRAHLDTALSRAQKRFTEAVRELARVRRLQAPKILAQLNLATTQTVVNGNGSGATAKV
jgi:hypothetical protein